MFFRHNISRGKSVFSITVHLFFLLAIRYSVQIQIHLLLPREEKATIKALYREVCALALYVRQEIATCGTVAWHGLHSDQACELFCSISVFAVLIIVLIQYCPIAGKFCDEEAVYCTCAQLEQELASLTWRNRTQHLLP